MTPNQEKGNQAEREVVELVPCPNCGKSLMSLPPGTPIYDVQCTRCLFRAQVKYCSGERHVDIRFYPFVPRTHLKKRQLSETAQRANYWMFDYIDLDNVPYKTLYRK